MEGLEAGAEVLLMDEDTCASNFMIRDANMQKLVNKKDEPITPFVDQARKLFSHHGISTILVLGGSGDYFDISDTIIQMKQFVPYNVTQAAHDIARSSPVERETEMCDSSTSPIERIPLPGSINPLNKYGKRSVYATEVNRIRFGQYTIDLTDGEQIVELEQTKAIMHALLYLDRYIDGDTRLSQIFQHLKRDLGQHGLGVLCDRADGNLAFFRQLELASALNRLRSLKMKQKFLAESGTV